MVVLHTALLLAHLLGLVAVVYGAITQLGLTEKRITPPVVWGAVVQLVTGLALVGVLEADDGDVNHMKIGVKLVVSLAVVGLAHSQRRRAPVAAGVIWALLALVAVNIAVAVLW